MKPESSLGNTKSSKISELRAAILRAEKNEDEKAVLLLEAELRAVERGEIFNKEEFLAIRNKAATRPRHHVLKDMHNMPTAFEGDIWAYDGINHKILGEGGKSYRVTFKDIFFKEGVGDFEELVKKRAIELKRHLNILDLFGGAYFLDNLDNVSKLIGVRLKNVDNHFIDLYKDMGSRALLAAQKFEQLVNDPRRFIVEGNLYSGKTWNKLSVFNTKKGGQGFDLIVCRPEGPFGINTNEKSIKDIDDKGLTKEKIFIVLLERALSLLSSDGGLLFAQIPQLSTSQEVWDKFWKEYIVKKENEGYEFLFEKGRTTSPRDVFAIRRIK